MLFHFHGKISCLQAHKLLWDETILPWGDLGQIVDSLCGFPRYTDLLIKIVPLLASVAQLFQAQFLFIFVLFGFLKCSKSSIQKREKEIS